MVVTSVNSDDARNDYPDGKYVKCRVLGSAKSKATVDLSLRDARLEGDLEDDYIPEPNEMTHAYVVSTTKKGCFVRLSRSVEGRVILKELSDDFIPDPTAMFPPGRLVVGKVKNVTKSDAKKKGNNGLTATVDIDMRESVLLSSGDRLTIDDIQENSKYTGVISRVESYGVFIRIDNSDVSGLAHVSECSDTYVKNIFDLYNPGDLVKVLVIKMDKEQRRLGFSLKPSNFVDDDDSDDESASGVESSSEESDGEEGKDAMNDSSDDEDSDDENFVTKMAAKMKKSGDNEMDVDGSDEEESTNSSSGSDDDSDSDEESDDEKPEKSLPQSMDTNVGFDWGSTSKPSKSDKLAESSDDDSTDSSSDSSDDDSDDADTGFKSSHKARKRAAAKRREEEEISRREVALADGTADENPETAADFERLVASSPNSSEIWIKYMAFHLSLADMDSARNVANRAFDRIEFRQEGEKVSYHIIV